MLTAYSRLMDAIQRGCMIVAGFCLVIITIIIPWGVFTRYVLGVGSSWPEPMAVLLMIWFSFMAAAICYREHLHIGVAILPNALSGLAANAARLAGRDPDGGDEPLHARLRHQPSANDLVSVDLRFSDRDRGHVLSAGADRRRYHPALRDRAAVARHALRDG